MSQSDIAISIRNISKSYTISHQTAGLRGRRPSFRDTVTSFVRNPFRKSAKETFWALKDVTMDVKRGDIIGIIGRNGAGKSTLLKILSRITKPSGGEIDAYGRIGSLLEVGTGFHPELTGRENIFLNGAILGMHRPEIRRQFDAIVDFAGVEKFLDTPVKRYSSGMYVRLAFGVAAHLQSEILIIDEVLAVGDGEFQRKCLGKMKDVANSGRTVLFVSHNMAAIQSLCASAMMLRAGRVQIRGSTSDVVKAYLSEGVEESDGHIDLRTHSAPRFRQFTPWLESIRIENREGKTTSRLASSEGLRATISVRPPRPVRNPQLALSIEDQYGRRISTSTTNFTQPETGNFSEGFTARCDMSGVGLGPGRYMVSVSISEMGTGLLDSVDGAGWFEVEWDNCYPSGALHESAYFGPVVCVGKWELAS